jgi:hypothetical protein
MRFGRYKYQKLSLSLLGTILINIKIGMRLNEVTFFHLCIFNTQ